jgi:1-phosphofructokinase family hexose kinase
VFERLNVGQVNRAREAHWIASGKVLNVGTALHHLGGESTTVALIGGLTGRSIDGQCGELGISRRWVWSEKPTRVCTTLLDHETGAATELVENAAAVREEELAAFVEAYAECAGEADYVILSGSLPVGTPRSFYRGLMERTRVPVILDASGAELMEALPMRPLCVKPNREELARTLGRPIRSEQDLRDAMAETGRRGAEWIVVSHGADALWALGRGAFYTLRPPTVSAVNPIGSGDCLAAGIGWALREGRDMLDAIRFAMAAAAENAAMLLTARLDPPGVRERMKEIAPAELRD